jgi:hypothetical protein
MNGFDLNKMRNARDNRKAEKSKQLKIAREKPEVSPAARAERLRSENGTLVPVRVLDMYGDPAVSFELKDKRRPGWLEILAGSKKAAAYKSLVKKLGSAFSRIYERYRREAERQIKGKAYYTMFDTERKKCEVVGVLCVMKGVTPSALIEYWDRNIKHFADGSLLIPPLTLLASPSNVDAVAVSSLAARKTRRDLDKPTPVAKRNSFSDVDGLDRRLRPGLERAGFSTQAYNDRYLLTVQHNAISLAKGVDLVLAGGKMRRMCEWAAKNLFQMEEAS